MIESILHETDEAKKLQIVVYNHLTLRKVWCESCGQQGHKFYECPEKLLATSASVLCNICKSKSHPTSDCPVKRGRRVQDQLGQPAIMAAEADLEMDMEAKPALYAGMETTEDNPDEELHRLI